MLFRSLLRRLDGALGVTLRRSLLLPRASGVEKKDVRLELLLTCGGLYRFLRGISSKPKVCAACNHNGRRSRSVIRVQDMYLVASSPVIGQPVSCM